MAIIPMKKVSVAVPLKQADAMMRELQKWGILHVSMTQQDGLVPIANEDRALELSAMLEKVREAIAMVRRYDTTKAPMFAAQPTVTPEEYEAQGAQKERIESICEEVKSLEDEIATLRAEISKNTARIDALRPFAQADIPLEYQMGTRTVALFWGFFPVEVEQNAMQMLRELKGVSVQVYEKTANHIPVIVVAHRSAEKQTRSMLKDAGFVEARLESRKTTPAQRMAKLEERSRTSQNILEKVIAKAAQLAPYKTELMLYEDYLRNELEREQLFERLGQTRTVGVVEGYIRHYDETKIESIIEGVTKDCYYSITDVEDDDEEVPTATENKALVEPFEAVTEMYSIPSRKSIDHNALMMPFYFIFFGMMLSDAAYGIILTVGSLLFYKMKKPEGAFRKILLVLAICGVSTFIWGVLFGGWMGFTAPALLFNPLDSPIPMLVLCLGLGVVHLLAGLGMGAYINVKRKKPWSALFDQGSWILVLVSLPFFVVNVNVALGMLVVAAVMLVASQGRHEKKVAKKIMGGVKSLYDVTGYLSDILSYARIFGMALATAVIATVFNTIAGMLATSIPGYIFAAVVFLIGHVFNIGINTLGSYVHSSRLQYIEFFSKFFEGGGIRFEPLRVKMNHIRMQKKIGG